MKKIKPFLLFLFMFFVIIFLGSCGNNNSKDAYQIMFADYDGTVLYSTQVKAGEMPSYPLSEPTRKPDDDYSYVFSEWWPMLEKATEDKIYTAYYARTDKKEYTITSKNYDGTVLETQSVKEGETPEFSLDDPTKPIDGDNKYVFSGWNPKLAPVTGDATYTAEFINEDTKLCKISFYNYDNQVIKTIQVKEGQTPEFGDEAPIKPTDANNKYVFNGWIPALKPVTGDASYIADFTTVPLAYTLSLDLNGGTTSGKTPSPVKTDKITPDLLIYDLKKDNYKFDGWTYKDELIIDEKGNAISNLDEIQFESNVTLVAHYAKEAFVSIYYTPYNGAINLPLGDVYVELPQQYGSASKSDFHDWNSKVRLNINLLSNGYKFDGWYENNNLLSKNTTYDYYLFDKDVNLEARFTLSKCVLNISANNEDIGEVTANNYSGWGSELEIDHYYGETVTVVARAISNKKFLGWFNNQGDLLTNSEYFTFDIKYSPSLIAKWDYFKISYVLPDDIDNDSNNPDHYSTTMGKITLLDNLDAPFGYVFDCWTDNYDYVITEIDTSKMKDFVLEAQFKPAPEFEDFILDYNRIITGVRNEDVVNAVIPEGVLGIADEAFRGCSKLETISIPNTVKAIGVHAFAQCVSLKSITIPSSVTAISDYTFSLCTSLEEVNLHNAITSIGSNAFNCCKALKSLTLPNSINSIGSAALAHCSALESLTIPFIGDIRYKSTDETQYPLGYLFGNEYDDNIGVTNQQYYSDGLIKSSYYRIPSSLTSVTITDSAYIQYGVFYSCISIKNISISNKATSIGNYAFYGCSALENVNLPNTVTSIGGYAFCNCSTLESITLPTALTEISSRLFANCYKLSSISLPDKVTSIGESAFSRCSVLEDVEMKNVTYVGREAFSYCKKLSKVNYNTETEENVLADNIEIADYGFGHTGLINITIGKNAKIGQCAFYYSSLVSVKISSGTTTISFYTFGKCDSLEKIYLPATITQIGASAFEGSTLKTINFAGTTSQWNSIKKLENWNKDIPATEVICDGGTVAL